MNVLKECEGISEELILHRRTVHSLAETGFDIPKTIEYISSVLRKNGIEPRHCGGGIIADIEGKSTEKIILRADCDALPIAEKSGLPFSASNGCGHLCGHDMHTAMLLGVAKIIIKNKHRLTRGVRLAFQGAEETLSGAKRMLECGVADGICAAYGMHVLPAVPFKTGTVILPPDGACAPYADFFRITVTGRESHGAAPHAGRDALLCASRTVCALESLISRESDPQIASCLTVGSLHAGNAANAICGTAVMEGTLRTFDREHAKYLSVRLAECAKYTALASGCVAVTEILSSSPALINSSALLTRATELFRRELPYVLSSHEAKMQKSIGGSEDFAYFSQKIPSLFFSLSAGDTNFSPYPLHHPAVRFDEGCLPYGCAALCALAFDENGGKD